VRRLFGRPAAILGITAVFALAGASSALADGDNGVGDSGQPAVIDTPAPPASASDDSVPAKPDPSPTVAPTSDPTPVVKPDPASTPDPLKSTDPAADPATGATPAPTTDPGATATTGQVAAAAAPVVTPTSGITPADAQTAWPPNVEMDIWSYPNSSLTRGYYEALETPGILFTWKDSGDRIATGVVSQLPCAARDYVVDYDRAGGWTPADGTGVTYPYTRTLPAAPADVSWCVEPPASVWPLWLVIGGDNDSIVSVTIPDGDPNFVYKDGIGANAAVLAPGDYGPTCEDQTFVAVPNDGVLTDPLWTTGTIVIHADKSLSECKTDSGSGGTDDQGGSGGTTDNTGTDSQSGDGSGQTAGTGSGATDGTATVNLTTNGKTKTATPAAPVMAPTLASTGSNAAAAALITLITLIVGTAAVVVARRRHTSAPRSRS